MRAEYPTVFFTLVAHIAVFREPRDCRKRLRLMQTTMSDTLKVGMHVSHSSKRG